MCVQTWKVKEALLAQVKKVGSRTVRVRPTLLHLTGSIVRKP
jgi:hypothetical protein